MKTFVMGTVAALAVALSSTAYAQDTAASQPHGYMIANYDVHDQAGYQQYLAAATPELLAKFGGHVIVFNLDSTAVEASRARLLPSPSSRASPTRRPSTTPPSTRRQGSSASRRRKGPSSSPKACRSSSSDPGERARHRPRSRRDGRAASTTAFMHRIA